MNRRLFLAQSAAMAVGGAVPTLWRRAAKAAGPDRDAPILVLVELTGGNDGLNTVIPFDDDAYHRARPSLRVEPSKVLKLDDALGLHPAMTGLHRLWEDGALGVLMNVGYPSPNRSHFRSMEIWQSAELGPSPTSGWIGRMADADPSSSPPCAVGRVEMPLTLRGRQVAPIGLADLSSARLGPGARLDLPDGPIGDGRSPIGRVRRAVAAARDLGDRIDGIDPPDAIASPDSIDGRLATIRTLIEAGAGPRVFATAIDGFDTHANQQYAHQSLLRTLSDALARFHDELADRRIDDRVVVLVFSEFGRRVAENGSKGTDHGAASPMLLVGSPVAGGLIGGPPDLSDLIDGDLRHALDFRDVYASLLRGWLGVDPTSVLGPGRDDGLALLRV